MPFITKPAALASAATVLLGLAQAVAGILILCPTRHASAAEAAAFRIPAEDGYGVEECLQASGACGQAIADSWCVAHGHLKAVAFGSSADVTGTVPVRAGTAISPSDMLIRCGD